MDHKYSDGMIDLDVNTVVVDTVGMILFALYHGIIIIVLVNMLIAMMSHSFEIIQVRYVLSINKSAILFTVDLDFNICSTKYNEIAKITEI